MRKHAVLAGITLLAVVIVGFLDPIPQDPLYHVFADQRTLLAIPHFWNVVTNIPFAVVGLMGMALVGSNKAIGGLPELKQIYFLFFMGVLATGIGSAYYHLDPTNATLLGDRMAMAVSFMAFFCMIIGEHVSIGLGRKLLWPLISLGIFSLFYWYATEQSGRGDLRLYGVVQYLPLLLIPVILILYAPKVTPVGYLWAVLAAYFVAKVAELLDRQMFHAVLLSGHSVKHLIAAYGTYIFYTALRRRRPVKEQ